MCNMCFLPSTGISARIFAKWLELSTLNEINDLIETGFVQTTTRRTISLHPMIQEITLSETKPSVTRCHILLDSLHKICLMTANLSHAKTHFKKAFKIYEKIWADEPEMIEAKYREIQELYPQIGFSIGKTLSGLLTK